MAETAPGSSVSSELTKPMYSPLVWAKRAFFGFLAHSAPGPHLVLVLDLPSEVTIQRRPEERPDHLEARYNYEDKNTASLWAGYRFKFGKGVKFVIVPMAAIVFGNTNGVAPGLEMEIMYKKFDFYSESEHVFDFSSKENNFFYMYTELAIRPINALRTGIMTQRTRVFESDRELQRGIFAEYYFGRFRAGVFYFNPFDSDQFWVASFSVDF